MKAMLKKYKDKLYTFLVLKNSAIASEYQAYVMADTERHEKHKLKSWLFLLKLNWKYRVLRGKQTKNTGKKQGNQPYVGSESSISSRIEPIHFAQNLMKYDIISFDIFDTLILRRLHDPKNVFNLISEEELWIKFKEHRVNAEQSARINALNKNGTREVNIFDIYKEVNKITGIDINYGITTEFEIEKKICYANPYMVEVVRFLREQNKQIICTSDMYWPKEYLKELLTSVGYSDFDNIFVSCDYIASKAEGTLFKKVREVYGDNLSYIHIGDNYNADILGAEKENFNSYFYKGINAIGNKYRTLGISPLFQSAYNGTINARLHKDERVYSPQYEFGYIYGGWYIFGFVNYILTFCKANNIDNILFFSRDGDIYKQVADILNEDNNLKTNYLLWSRLCNIKYAINFDRDFFIQRVCKVQAGLNRTFENILDGFELGFLKSYMHIDELQTILTSDTLEYFIEFLVNNIDKVEEYYSQTLSELEEYFKYLIGNSKSILLVDIGWMGTAPLNVKKLLRDIWKIDIHINIMMVASRYMGTSGTNNQFNFYIFNENNGEFHRRVHSNKHTSIFELFTQSTNPSFGGLKKNRDKTEFNFQSPDIENYAMTKEIQKGILDFVIDYKKAFKDFKYLYNISGQDAYVPFRFLMGNKNAINNMVGFGVQQIHLNGNGTEKAGYKTIKEIMG